MFAFNVTMEERIKYIHLPLLDEGDQKDVKLIEVDFFSNGMIRKRDSNELGGRFLFELYDFSTGASGFIPFALFQDNGLLSLYFLVGEASSTYYKEMKKQGLNQYGSNMLKLYRFGFGLKKVSVHFKDITKRDTIS
jgi:hypothetical protein